jgi:hypothetical protein
MKSLLKWPLVIAVIVVVGRVLLERLGAPYALANAASAALLHTLIIPLYFAWRISGSTAAHPYKDLFTAILLYAVLVRAMVAVTYWLAYIYQWPDPRFSVAASGVVGPGVTPIEAFLWIPLVLTLSWTIGSLIIGGGLGSVVMAIRRRRLRAAAH